MSSPTSSILPLTSHRPCCARRIGVLLLLGWLLCCSPHARAAQVQPVEEGLKPAEQEHLHFDLSRGLENHPLLVLYGPQGKTVAHTEAEGLRITLPQGRDNVSPVGVELRRPLRGDFDVTLSFELLAVGQPLPKYGVGLVLRLWFDNPEKSSVIVSFSRKPNGDDFGSHKIIPGPDGKDKYLDSKHLKAAKAKGKLRLVRTGPQLQFLVAEDRQPFKPLQTQDIGTGDVKALKVYASTQYTPTAIDVRLSDLDLHVNRLANAPLAAPVVQEKRPDPVEVPSSRSWLIALLLMGLGLMLVFAVAAALVLFLRQRRAN